MRQVKYKNDIYGWALSQVHLLKKGDFQKVDLKNVIEEIEDLAKSERKALKNQIIRLLMHLLKVKYQPSKHSKSWDKSIGNSRIEIEQILSENPSLKRELSKVFEESYPYARKKAHIETALELKTFPEECPWSLKKALYE